MKSGDAATSPFEIAAPERSRASPDWSLLRFDGIEAGL